MKLVRSALVAVVITAGGTTAIQGSVVYAEGNVRIAQQQTGSCFVTVAYLDKNRETRTKTTCVKDGELRCNNLKNSFCEPIDHPDVVSRACKVVPSCPDMPK